MPYKTNDFQSDLSISELFANFMEIGRAHV